MSSFVYKSVKSQFNRSVHVIHVNWPSETSTDVSNVNDYRIQMILLFICCICDTLPANIEIWSFLRLCITENKTDPNNFLFSNTSHSPFSIWCWKCPVHNLKSSPFPVYPLIIKFSICTFQPPPLRTPQFISDQYDSLCSIRI